MSAWGTKLVGDFLNPRRPEEKVRDVVDDLFLTRFWDKGKCDTCKSEATGIWGPKDFHDKFYCRKCWLAYFRSSSDMEWKEWTEWKPAKRQVLTTSSGDHELKCALLALSRVGGSISFPPNLSSYNRQQVHSFCEQEPELSSLSKKSYGKGDKRFLRVTSQGDNSVLEEARALLAAEELDSMPVGKLEALQQELKLGLEAVQSKLDRHRTKGHATSPSNATKQDCNNEDAKVQAPRPPPPPRAKDKEEDSSSKQAPAPKPPPRAKDNEEEDSNCKAATELAAVLANLSLAPAVEPEPAAVPEPSPPTLPKPVAVAGIGGAVCESSDFPSLSAFPSLSGGSSKKGGKKKR